MPNLDPNLLDSLEKQTYNQSVLNLSSKKPTEKLTDADVEILIPLLVKNPKIKALDLTNNLLTNKSAELLAQNNTLSTLKLKPGNKEITLIGLKAFLNNYTITTLPIIGGSGKDLDALRAHIKKNPQRQNIVVHPVSDIPKPIQENKKPLIIDAHLLNLKKRPVIQPIILSAPKPIQENNKLLITDERLFPRSEYYTRFKGTTAFAMENPAYWGTYHRSESSRFFDIAGDSKNKRTTVQFSSPLAKKPPKKTHSFYAHTGGYRSPFSMASYAEALSLDKLIDEGKIDIRDRLLWYKNEMAKIVVNSFEVRNKNKQKIGKKKSYIRPIAYAEHDYPCVLVALPVLNTAEIQTEATKYWDGHKKPFQRLILCSFIAFLNVEAIQEGIPIEMVLRASFGHNSPSICETDDTFRINVGLIPQKYAILIGKALYKLNEAINAISDHTSQPAPFDDSFHARVRVYNVNKLKEVINENACYVALRGTRDFIKAEHSEEAFQRLYKSFAKIDKDNKVRKASFYPVMLKDKNIWQVIRAYGDSGAKSVLNECFREKGTEDWFTNQIMEALLTGSANPIETALDKLLRCLVYGEKAVTMNYEKIHRELKFAKREFANPSFEKIYAEDPAFSEMVEILCGAFSIDKPTTALYAELERGGIKLLTTHKASEQLSEQPDFGSDSEFSDELTDVELTEKPHLSHVKLRVCAGMKAILLAHYGALSYLYSLGIANYDKDIQQMYYEVEEALRFVEISKPVRNKIRANIIAEIKTGSVSKILHFDLNHCNAGNSADNKNLKEKLNTVKPRIVVLDYTSSISQSVEKALHECLSNQAIEFVICVNSGLKNDQGGLDFNPYGEVRICARNRKIATEIYEMMQKGLSEEDKLSQKTHGLVRVCKRSKLALSFYDSFKRKSNDFQFSKTNEQ